jgi:hypothetical protein
MLSRKKPAVAGIAVFGRCQVKKVIITTGTAEDSRPLRQHSSEDPAFSVTSRQTYMARVECPRSEDSIELTTDQPQDSRDAAIKNVQAFAAAQVCHNCVYGNMDPLAVVDYRLALAEAERRLKVIQGS